MDAPPDPVNLGDKVRFAPGQACAITAALSTDSHAAASSTVPKASVSTYSRYRLIKLSTVLRAT